MEYLAVYGITQAEDVRMVYETKNQKNRVEELATIQLLFDSLQQLAPYSNNAFQDAQFATTAETEQLQMDIHTQFAENSRELCIESKDGLKLSFSVYPDYVWLYGAGAMPYSRADETLLHWYKDNLMR